MQTITMSFRNRFSSLAAQLVSLLDAGKKLDMDETHQHIRNKTIFPWLQEKFPDRIDLSSHEPEDITLMEHQFNTWSHIIDERRAMEVKHNGLCLLIAYCLEAIEANPNTMRMQEPGT
jgi:hypothetical protein